MLYNGTRGVRPEGGGKSTGISSLKRGDLVEKRRLSRGQFGLLQQELNYWASQEVLSGEQVSRITAGYEVKSTLNFIRVILLLGSLLMGLGILSFIASNWQEMSKLIKFTLIALSFLGFNLAGYRLQPAYPKVARSFIYIGVFIYGAGIFLIGQMFNFGGHFSSAFLFWAVGILPMGLLIKDKIIFVFAHALLLIYINGNFELDEYPYVGFLLAPVLYYANRYFNYAKLITFANNLVALNLLGFLLIHNHVDSLWVCLTFFAVGLLFFLLPVPFNRLVFKIQGLLLAGIFGLLLTIPDIWETAFKYDHSNIYFAVIYLILLLTLIRHGNLAALVFFCLTILRFYVDTFYDFMPKSLFFVLGGVMLLGFGYYFERKRKVQGGLGFEK